MSNYSDTKMAYCLLPSEDRFPATAGGYLPKVSCEHCGESTSGGAVDFPLLHAADLHGDCWQMDVNNLVPRVCSWREFLDIQTRARLSYRDETLTLAPLGTIGPICVEPQEIVRTQEPLPDIQWCQPGGLMLSVDLLGLLDQHGIRLKHHLVRVPTFATVGPMYGLVQSALHRMLHPETLRLQSYDQCSACGGLKVLNPRQKPARLIFLDARFRDRIEPLFSVVGYDTILFLSDELKAAFDVIKPTGLAMEPFGQWRD